MGGDGWTPLALDTAIAEGIFVGAPFSAARHYNEVRVLDAVIAVPIAFGLALAAVIFGRKARIEHQRTLGRSGSRLFVGLVRLLSAIAFVLALTAALALVVFAALELVFA